MRKRFSLVALLLHVYSSPDLSSFLISDYYDDKTSMIALNLSMPWIMIQLFCRWCCNIAFGKMISDWITDHMWLDLFGEPNIFKCQTDYNNSVQLHYKDASEYLAICPLGKLFYPLNLYHFNKIQDLSVVIQCSNNERDIQSYVAFFCPPSSGQILFCNL